MSLQRIVLLGLILFSMNAKAVVWESLNTWNFDWERKYSDWFSTEFQKDIFSNPDSPWFGVQTDCADAVYAARTIFSFTHSLPIDFRRSTGNPQLQNSSSEWDHLPPKNRFLQFLKVLLIATDTSTLSEDTFPLKISSQTISPGVIFLNPARELDGKTLGGHVDQILSIDDNGYLQMIFSTTPAKIRTLSLSRNPYHWPSSERGGFRSWRWPGVPAVKMTSYSLEQFSFAGWKSQGTGTRRQIFQWHESIRKLIRSRSPTFSERRDVVVESICNMWKGRKEAVEIAWQDINKNGMRCLSKDQMEDHSTIMRDRRIQEGYRQLYDLLSWYKSDSGDTQLFGDLRDAEAELRNCSFDLAVGHRIDAWELFLRQRDGKLVSDAKWSPGVRWGAKVKSGGSTCRQ